MSTPTWILGTFGVLMILIAEASAAQLLLARAWTRPGRPGADVAVLQLLTGIALTGVLVPGLAVLPSAVWAGVFAVLTAWFAWSLWPEIRGQATDPARATTVARVTALARAPHAPYLLQCAAMLYILAVLATSPAASSAVPTPDVSSSPAAGMAGMPGMIAPAAISSAATSPPHVTTLALLLAVLLTACLVRALDQPARTLATAATKACQVTLSLTMALILIIR